MSHQPVTGVYSAHTVKTALRSIARRSSNCALASLGLGGATGFYSLRGGRAGTPHGRGSEKYLISMIEKSDHALVSAQLEELSHPKHRVFHPIIHSECHSASPSFVF